MRNYLGAQLLSVSLTISLGSTLTSFAQDTGTATNGTNLADLSLEQLLEVRIDRVEGASKREQMVTKAPASVSIVTAEEIQKFGHRNLSDALRGVRGMFVADDRNYDYLGIRGFQRPGDYNTRVLVLIDGHRMNDNIYDTSLIGNDPIDIDLVDRIEVIRGPSSSIYGSSAFLGVINIVTRAGARIDGVEASTEAASYDTYKGRFTFGDQLMEDVQLTVSGSYYTSQGAKNLYFPEFDQRITPAPYARNYGNAHRLDDEEAASIFTSATYREFTLSASLNFRDKQVPTASFGTIFADPGEQTTDRRSYLDLKWDHSFSDEMRVIGRCFYDYYDYKGDYPYNYADPGEPIIRVLSQDHSNGQWAGTEWQMNAQVLERHMITTGLEYRENIRAHQDAWENFEPKQYSVRSNVRSRNFGAFAQADIQVLDDLILTSGLRCDYYSDSFGYALSPRIGLIYNAWEGGTFKALYGEAFRAPNAYERYYYAGQTQMPDLDPETIQTYEVVYEQYLGTRYRTSLSAYYYAIEDLVTLNSISGTDDLGFANLDEAAANGLEAEFEARFEPGFLARASYAIQRAWDSDTRRELTNSPRHLAKLGLSHPLFSDQIFAGIELQYNGSVHTVKRSKVSDFFLLNFTLFSRELVKGLELSASAYNLLDTAYAYAASDEFVQEAIPQDGISFRVKLTYHF